MKARLGLRLLGVGTVVLALATAQAASVSSELAFHRGVAAFGQERYDEARELFESVLREDPQDAAALSYLGLIARKKGKLIEAVAFYQKAVLADPDDLDLKTDLGTLLLELDEPREARELAAEVIEAEPDHARARLLEGMAAYRERDYAAALPDLQRAAEQDPSLRTHAKYYTALSEAFLGNATEAAAAFSAVEQDAHPLASRARTLREQLRPAEPSRGEIELTAGREWDDNVNLIGESVSEPERDARWVYRLRGRYDALRSERAVLRFGYDGYVAVQDELEERNTMTNVGSVAFTYTWDTLRFGLQYEGTYAQMDDWDSYLRSHRVTPSITLRQGQVGVTQLFGQLDKRGYFEPTTDDRLDRDGTQTSYGLNQYFFLPGDRGYLRLGARGDHMKASGREFSFRGYELSAGAGIELPFGAQLTAIYRRTNRRYDGKSILAFDKEDAEPTRRRDAIDRVSVELSVPIRGGLSASIEANWTKSGSNLALFAHERGLIGTYLTYRY